MGAGGVAGRRMNGLARARWWIAWLIVGMTVNLVTLTTVGITTAGADGASLGHKLKSKSSSSTGRMLGSAANTSDARMQTLSLVLRSSVSAGSVVVLGVGAQGSVSVKSVYDSRGNLYHVDAVRRVAPTVGVKSTTALVSGLVRNRLRAGDQISVTLSQGNAWGFVAQAWTGIIGLDRIGRADSGSGASAHVLVRTSRAVGQSNELVFGVVTTQRRPGLSAGSGFRLAGRLKVTEGAAKREVALEYGVVRTAGVQTATFKLRSRERWAAVVGVYSTGAASTALPPPAPTPLNISALFPTAGPPGTRITIQGSGFTGAVFVKFGSTDASSFTVESDGRIAATVPPSAPRSAPVSVSTTDGTVASPVSFTNTAFGMRGTSAAPEHALWGLAVANAAVSWSILEDGMHAPFASVGSYHPFTRNGKVTGFPNSIDMAAASRGASLYLNLASWNVTSSGKHCYSWSGVASGQDDAILQAWVDKIKAWNYPHVVLVFHHEPDTNTSNEPSCGTPAQYQAAYEHVWSYFTSHGINYPWAWDLTAASFIGGSAASYQPPASEFNYVGVDGYNRDANGWWRTPAIIFSAAERYAVNLGKPLFIGEVGTVEDPSDPTAKASWYESAAQLFAQWGVAAVQWNDEAAYRPDSTPESLAGWLTASADSYFVP